MAWQGYIAMGNVASGVFTECSATNYARTGFSFRDSHNGRVQGFGPRYTWTGVTGSVTGYNAYAFFVASSGGQPLLVYPMPTPMYLGLGKDHTVTPATIVLNLIDGTTTDALPMDMGGVAAISGVEAAEANFSATAGLTAHAGGGQANALPLTTTINRVDTVATTADSVLLPNSVPGAFLVVNNSGANSMNVFPQSGDLINALSANAAYAVAAAKTVIFVCALAGKWNTVLTA